MRSWADSASPDESVSPDELDAGYIHVWRLDLRRHACHTDELVTKLSAPERERAARFKRPVDRRNFVLTRAVLRALIAAYLDGGDECGARPEDISINLGWSAEIVAGTHGKPALSQHFQARHLVPGQGALAFNIAHAGDISLLAFGRSGALGVDVEKIRPRRELEAVSRQYFRATEARRIFENPEQGDADLKRDVGPEMPENLRYDGPRQKNIKTNHKMSELDAFYRFWTKKEAYIKALGTGFSTDLRSFEVSAEPRAPLVDSDRGDADDWELCELTPRDGYVGALCVANKTRRPANYLRTMTATVSNSLSVQLFL